MRQRSLGFKLVATVVIASLQAWTLPAIASNPDASVKGAILSATDEKPLPGAKLHLGDPKTGEIYTSSPADDQGGYHLDHVPASTYEMAVESDGGLYVVQTPLTLAPGQAQSVNLAVNPQMVPAAMTEEEKKKNKGGTSIWNNPGIAALIVVGAAVVLGLIIDAATNDNEEQPASPSN